MNITLHVTGYRALLHIALTVIGGGYVGHAYVGPLLRAVWEGLTR